MNNEVKSYITILNDNYHKEKALLIESNVDSLDIVKNYFINKLNFDKDQLIILAQKEDISKRLSSMNILGQNLVYLCDCDLISTSSLPNPKNIKLVGKTYIIYFCSYPYNRSLSKVELNRRFKLLKLDIIDGSSMKYLIDNSDDIKKKKKCQKCGKRINFNNNQDKELEELISTFEYGYICLYCFDNIVKLKRLNLAKDNKNENIFENLNRLKSGSISGENSNELHVLYNRFEKIRFHNSLEKVYTNNQFQTLDKHHCDDNINQLDILNQTSKLCDNICDVNFFNTTILNSNTSKEIIETISMLSLTSGKHIKQLPYYANYRTLFTLDKGIQPNKSDHEYFKMEYINLEDKIMGKKINNNSNNKKKSINPNIKSKSKVIVDSKYKSKSKSKIKSKSKSISISTITSNNITSTKKRSAPKCRKCGNPMKGHSKNDCSNKNQKIFN